MGEQGKALRVHLRPNPNFEQTQVVRCSPPIVKSIIETHQGSLKVDSTMGQGTVVTITLPELSLEKVA